MVAVAITIHRNTFFGRTTLHPQEVYLARLEDGVDASAGESLIRSNYVDGEYVYFFNAPPGRYVAVASYGCRTTSTWFSSFHCPDNNADDSTVPSGSWRYGGYPSTYFPRALIEETVVDVQTSSLVFLGRIELDIERMEEPDEAQLYYRTILDPTYREPQFLKSLSPNPPYNPVVWEVDRSEDVRKRFLADSEDSLSAWGWASFLKAHESEPSENSTDD